MSTDYAPEQKKSLEIVRGLVGELVELENLQKKAYQCPVIGLEGAMDQAIADISLDNHPPYHVLEDKLGGAIKKAKSLGLSNDSYIQKIESLVFS